MMIHPSYKEMITAVNSEVEDGTVPVVSSRYSIVMATAKRARQLIDGDEALVESGEKEKPSRKFIKAPSRSSLKKKTHKQTGLSHR